MQIEENRDIMSKTRPFDVNFENLRGLGGPALEKMLEEAERCVGFDVLLKLPPFVRATGTIQKAISLLQVFRRGVPLTPL